MFESFRSKIIFYQDISLKKKNLTKMIFGIMLIFYITSNRGHEMIELFIYLFAYIQNK